jgi:DNA modification methylase
MNNEKSRNDKRRNDLNGKEWLQNSFSIWRDLKKSAEEKKLRHPASYPSDLVEKAIRSFSRIGSTVLDPFNGVGSTMEGCLKAGSKGVGIDLSPEFCEIARNRCDSEDIQIINGDSIKVLKDFSEGSFDLCITSPPYWDILNMKRSVDKKVNLGYSDSNEDLGNISNYDEFLDLLESLFTEVHRTLKSDKYCIVNVMDLRKKDKFYPLHSDLADRMKKIGFIYDDLIIWDRQHEYNNMKTLGYPYRFRINKVHEYLMIFLKK